MGNGHWREEGGEKPMILGYESFASSTGIDGVTANLLRQLTTHTDWSASSLRSLGSMVFELTENVMQHSHAKGGVTVLQILPAEQRIVLAIADSGIGVRDSLAQNPEFSDIGDDLTAIAKAMGAGTTGEPGTGGGMGLFLARCLIRSNEGSFLLRSGEACREENDTVDDFGGLPRLHGTLISVDVRTDRPLDYTEVESHLRLVATAAG
jgi:anti-sigma regulatory factor (Ser/Thr protein kinase)